MVVNYKERKEEVLSHYNECMQIVSELEELGSKINHNLLHNCDRVTNIDKLAKKIKENQFRIMVAGESKSGKSTFINAYLGTDILPMDVKQCTSSIIRIKYNKDFSARITYAGGKTEKMTDKDKVHEFLVKHAALDDNYREIPTTTINYELLVKAGKMCKEDGKQIIISESDIKYMLETSEIKKANIHNMLDYEDKIREYINITKNRWEDIVTEIEILYPFGDDLKGIEIVDSPGISARGGVAEITSKYIKEADSIIFLKPSIGQSLESKEFNDFLDSNIIKRNIDTLFLVFTHRAVQREDDIRRLEEEAYKQFSSKISKNNILFVDSKAELYLKQFSNIDNFEEEFNKFRKSGKLDDMAKSAYFDSEGDFEKFKQILEEKSCFNMVYEVLDKFGRKAHYINMKELLNSIKTLYDIMLANISDLIVSYKEKAKNPQELAKKIANLKNDIHKLEKNINNDLVAILQEYTGQNGKIREIINKRAEEFEEKIKKINNKSEDAFDRLKDETFNKLDEYKEFVTSIQNEIILKYQEKICFLTKYDFISTEAILPDFTTETFLSIMTETRKKAYELQEIDEGITFGDVQKRPTYTHKKHVNLVRNSIRQRMVEIKGTLISSLIDYTEKVKDKYYEELQKNIDFKMKEYDVVLKDQAVNVELIDKIKKLEICQTKIQKEQKETIKVAEGIYV